MKKLIAWGRKVIHSFLASKCNVHAAGLTYFTLLAVVPVLCCILVVAKTCRVDEIARSQINRHIDATISNIVNSQDDALAKLTPCDEEARRKKKIAAEEFAMQARSVSNALFDRIEQFDVGTLGWIGFCALLWTVVSTLGSIETSFNSIFAVEKALGLGRADKPPGFVAFQKRVHAHDGFDCFRVLPVGDAKLQGLEEVRLSRRPHNGRDIRLLDKDMRHSPGRHREGLCALRVVRVSTDNPYVALHRLADNSSRSMHGKDF